MRRLLIIGIFVLYCSFAHAQGACPGGLPVTGNHCYFVSASGSDSNNGTTEATSWVHAPGMPNCTGTCGTVQTSLGGADTAHPGLGFIFKGGDTWHFGNGVAGVNAGGNWAWLWQGNSATCVWEGVQTGCLYIGVDLNWPSSGWTRPILTGDNPTSATAVASCAHQILANGGFNANVFFALTGNLGGVIFDNFELTGLCQNGNNGAAHVFDSGGNGILNNTFSNLYMHGWSVTSSATVNGCIGLDMSTNGNDNFDHIVMDGSDSWGPACTAFTFPTITHMRDSIFRYTDQGVGQGCHDIHDNIFEYQQERFDQNEHANILECNADAQGSTPNVFYNNIVRHVSPAFSSANQVDLWFCPNTTPEYWFNNIQYDAGNSNSWDIAGPPAYGCSNSGGQFMFNNTLEGITQPCFIQSQTQGGQFLTVFNEHLIATPFDTGSTPCTGVASATNVPMNYTTANSQGYTGTAGINNANTCQNDTTPCAPTSAGNSTVGSGANHTAYCTTLAGFSSEPAIGTDAANACKKGTTLACSYNNSAGIHAMVCPARTAIARPASGAWDSGAYEFQAFSGPSFSYAPSPVAFGNVTDSTSSALTVTITNNGTTNLVLGTLGSPSDAEYVTSSNTCSGQTVTPTNHCTFTETFTPTSPGSKPATISAPSNAATSPDTINLTGTGVVTGPIVSLSPTSLAFGNQGITTTSAGMVVTLTNTGNATLNITSITLTVGTQFAKSTTCGSTLGAGLNCTVTATFTPTTIGAKSDSLVFTTNAASSPDSVTLTGTGVVSPPCTMTEKNADYGADSATNTATVTANVNAIGDLVGITAWCFGASGGCTPVSVMMGSQSATKTSVNGVANPSVGATAGTGQGWLYYILSAAAAGTQTITFTSSGSVTDMQTSYIDFTPTAGCTVTHNVDSSLGSCLSGCNNSNITAPSITPTAGDLLFNFTWDSIHVTGVNSPWSCPIYSGSGETQSCFFNTTFNTAAYILSAASGATANNMTTFHPSDFWQSLITSFTPSSSTPTPIVSLTSSLAFGNQQINITSSPQIATLNNVGNGTLTISSIALQTGTQFKIVANTCGATLAAGNSCTVQVTFTPTTIAAKSDSLVVTTNAASSPDSTSLTGTGVLLGKISHVSGNCSQSSVVTESSGNTYTFGCTPNAIGDAVAFFVQCHPSSGGAISAISLAATGWTITQAVAPASTGSNSWGAVFGAIAPNTSAATFTATFTGASNCGSFATEFSDEFNGNNTTGGATTFNATGSTSGASNSCNQSAANITPPVNGEAVWFACLDNVSGVSSPWIQGSNDGGDGDSAEYQLLVSGAGVAQTPAYQSGAAGAFIIMGVAIAPQFPPGAVFGTNIGLGTNIGWH